MSEPVIARRDPAETPPGIARPSLGARLRQVAENIREASADFADAVDRFVERLEGAAAGATAPQIGDIMPDFMLPDQDGRMVMLDTLRAKGPVVVLFYRGHWCPYCRLTLEGFAGIQDGIAPASIVAISPERQQYTGKMREETGAHFPFLSDVGSGYALSLNLAIWVDDTMASLIADAGWHIPDYQGTNGWIMPVPAAFVIDADGRIVARHVDPDYRKRMEPEEVSGILKRIGSQAPRPIC